MTIDDGDKLVWAEAVGIIVQTEMLPHAHVIERAQLGTCQAALCGTAPGCAAEWMLPEEVRQRHFASDEERPPCAACFKLVDRFGGAA
jgi:hypothetical protein